MSTEPQMRKEPESSQVEKVSFIAFMPVYITYAHYININDSWFK